MKTQPASPRMYSLIALYEMHTNYFIKALADISDEDAHNRLNTKANHVAWIAGSLVQERFEMPALLGGSGRKQKADDLFNNYQGIKEDVKYPSLQQFKEDWESITPEYHEVLSNITDEKLDSIFEMPDMPDMKMTYFELLSFMIYREANMIGQLALWRRLLGYDAIRYDQ